MRIGEDEASIIFEGCSESNIVNHGAQILVDQGHIKCQELLGALIFATPDQGADVVMASVYRAEVEDCLRVMAGLRGRPRLFYRMLGVKQSDAERMLAELTSE
jgi:hypothetical protein